jgi:hypothetical protein
MRGFALNLLFSALTARYTGHILQCSMRKGFHHPTEAIRFLYSLGGLWSEVIGHHHICVLGRHRTAIWVSLPLTHLNTGYHHDRWTSIKCYYSVKSPYRLIRIIPPRFTECRFSSQYFLLRICITGDKTSLHPHK